MEITDISVSAYMAIVAAVASGGILTGIFFICIRRLDVQDDRDAPITAMVGVVLILGFLASSFYLSSR